MKVEPGTLPVGVRWLIASACAVTIVLVSQGMTSIWEFADSTWDVRQRSSGELYTSWIPVLIAAAVAAAFALPSRHTRYLRAALMLPFIHLATILIAYRLWLVVQDEMQQNRWLRGLADIPLPPVSSLAIAVPALFAVAIVIKRRHGEWAHAAVMLSLSSLFFVGTWLPFVTAVHANGGSYSYTQADYGVNYWTIPTAQITIAAIVPPLVAAIGFTTLAFRRPHVIARHRTTLEFGCKVLVWMAIVVMFVQPDAGGLIYLRFSYIVLFAALLAVFALVVLSLSVWTRSRLAHRRLARLPRMSGTVASQDDAAAIEITSWLRGIRLVSRSFVVATDRGDIPVHGATVLAAIGATSTSLQVGELEPVLAPGTRVTIAGHLESAEGHPFRAMDAAQVSLVAAPNARPFGLSDVSLVVWRPAVAYLAILLAVTLPALTILIT